MLYYISKNVILLVITKHHHSVLDIKTYKNNKYKMNFLKTYFRNAKNRMKFTNTNKLYNTEL